MRGEYEGVTGEKRTEDSKLEKISVKGWKRKRGGSLNTTPDSRLELRIKKEFSGPATTRASQRERWRNGLVWGLTFSLKRSRRKRGSLKKWEVLSIYLLHENF